MGRVPNKTGRSWTIGITLLGTNITYPLTKGTFESRTFLFLRWDTPWKINMEPTKTTHLERKMIFQTSMIMFHVNLQGCMLVPWRVTKFHLKTPPPSSPPSSPPCYPCPAPPGDWGSRRRRHFLSDDGREKIMGETDIFCGNPFFAEASP